MADTPTSRTLKAFRKLGFDGGVVERRNPRIRTLTNDFIGIIDVIVFRPGVGTIGLQVTSGSNHAARVAKAKAEPRLAGWLATGNRFEVVSWSKRGPAGKRKTWTMRREELTADDLDTVYEHEAA